jgi:hypothetical protein
VKEVRSTFRSEIIDDLVCVRLPLARAAQARLGHSVVREQSRWGLWVVDEVRLRGTVSYFALRCGISRPDWLPLVDGGN